MHESSGLPHTWPVAQREPQHASQSARVTLNDISSRTSRLLPFHEVENCLRILSAS